MQHIGIMNAAAVGELMYLYLKKRLNQVRLFPLR